MCFQQEGSTTTPTPHLSMMLRVSSEPERTPSYPSNAKRPSSASSSTQVPNDQRNLKTQPCHWDHRSSQAPAFGFEAEVLLQSTFYIPSWRVVRVPFGSPTLGNLHLSSETYILRLRGCTTRTRLPCPESLSHYPLVDLGCFACLSIFFFCFEDPVW